MNAILAQFKRFLLLAGDVFVLYLSLWLTIYLRYGSHWPAEWNKHLYPLSIIYILWLLTFYIFGLYDLKLARNNLDSFLTLVRAVAINAAIAIAFFYFIPYFGITPKTNLAINILLFAILFMVWRQIYNIFIKTPALRNNVLILGQNQETKELIQHIQANPQLGYYIKKIIDADDVRLFYDLIETIVQNKIHIIIATVDARQDADLVRNLYQCLPLKILVADLPTFYERLIGKIPVSAIEEVWFLENMMGDNRVFFESVKRVIDILIASLLAFLTLGLLPLIALLIKLDSPGSIFFRQKKVGLNNRIFETVKFRTRTAENKKVVAAKENLNSNATRVGRWLQKTRLDELPQLWNVLKGDLSLVGPRPEKPEFAFSNELLAQIPFYQIRHLVKPGLTGWAQIKKPYTASIKDTLEKLQYDFYYIKNRSLALETAIILKTIKLFLSGGGQ